jgi:hypothetical protein
MNLQDIKKQLEEAYAKKDWKLVLQLLESIRGEGNESEGD